MINDSVSMMMKEHVAWLNVVALLMSLVVFRWCSMAQINKISGSGFELTTDSEPQCC